MNKKAPYNIWIVEDEPMYRESLENLIQITSDFNLIHSANSVEKAIQAFGTKQKPDIILQDIRLPGLSGIDGINIYKKHYPEVLVVILTTFDDDEKVFDAILAGADGYLLKRTLGTEIIKSLKDLLNNGAPISPTIAKKIIKMMGNPSKKNKVENPLTDRETTILKYLVDGHTLKGIANKLCISRHTVDTHTKNIYRKLQVHNRSNLVSVAVKKGLV